jgi:hypothetical protein
MEHRKTRQRRRGIGFLIQSRGRGKQTLCTAQSQIGFTLGQR